MKTRDFVFACALILLGGYVIYESVDMYRTAAKPPFEITEMSISPALLPLVLGLGLVFCSAILLVRSLRGESDGERCSFTGHCREASTRVLRAVGDVNVQSMAVCVLIMGLYTFLILGRVPFWAGAITFLCALMLYLRAAKLWVIAAASVISVALVMLLFEGVFQTVLP